MMEISQEAIFTLPTAISVGGYALVCDGIERGITTPTGFMEVAAGRTMDLVDGYVARKFDQASEFGGLVDGGLDKRGIFKIMKAVKEEGLSPAIFEDAITAQGSANAWLTAMTKVMHPYQKLFPSRDGKRAMALQGLGQGAYPLAEMVKAKSPRLGTAIRCGGHALNAAGLFYYGPRATEGYARRFGRAMRI
jgi:phosphatidylglycerophosphate synthase